MGSPSSEPKRSPTRRPAWRLALRERHEQFAVLHLVSVLLASVGGVAVVVLGRRMAAPGAGGALSAAGGAPLAGALHGVIMLLLVLVPAIPTTVGAHALPRLVGLVRPRLRWAAPCSLLLYWTGAVAVTAAMGFGPIDARWTTFALTPTDRLRSALVLEAGIVALAFAHALTGLSTIATVHSGRRPLSRPLSAFAWSLYAHGLIQVFALPLAGATAALAWSERLLRVPLFDPRLGGDPLLLEHLYWLYVHAVTVSSVLPVMGLVSDILAEDQAVAAKGGRAVWPMLAVAVLGVLGWGVHLLPSGLSQVTATFFSLVTLFALVPFGVQAARWVGMITRWSVGRRPAALVACCASVALALAAASLLCLGTLHVGRFVAGASLPTAQLHALGVATLLALVAGLYRETSRRAGHDRVSIVAAVAGGLALLGSGADWLAELARGDVFVLSWGRAAAGAALAIPRGTGSWGLGVVEIALLMLLIDWARDAFLARPRPASDDRGEHAEA